MGDPHRHLTHGCQATGAIRLALQILHPGDICQRKDGSDFPFPLGCHRRNRNVQMQIAFLVVSERCFNFSCFFNFSDIFEMKR